MCRSPTQPASFTASTFSETLGEALLKADGQPLHTLRPTSTNKFGPAPDKMLSSVFRPNKGRSDGGKDAKPKKQSTIARSSRSTSTRLRKTRPCRGFEAGAFLLPVVVMIIIGLIAKWTWLTWIFTMITAIMLGMLLATMMLTRRADAVGYKQIDGKPGAAIGVLSNMKAARLRRNGVDRPEDQGCHLARHFDERHLPDRRSEYGRIIEAAMDRQETRYRGVTAGSSIPVYRITVGHGPKQVPLDKP